jgi:hypothetical protein
MLYRLKVTADIVSIFIDYKVLNMINSNLTISAIARQFNKQICDRKNNKEKLQLKIVMIQSMIFNNIYI